MTEVTGRLADQIVQRHAGELRGGVIGVGGRKTRRLIARRYRAHPEGVLAATRI